MRKFSLSRASIHPRTSLSKLEGDVIHFCIRLRSGTGASVGNGVGASVTVGSGVGNFVGLGVGTFVGTGVGISVA